VRAPKLLCVVSAIDLDFRYGATPAWWQIWKGMYEAGVDLIVTPYRGRPIATPWWRTEPNPCYREGELFAGTQRLAAGLRSFAHLRPAEGDPEQPPSERVSRELIRRYVTPRWQRHLERLLERERDVDAVVVFTVPMSHLRGVPTALRERFGLPVIYYDADMPMSLPEYGGGDNGFDMYRGADLDEYDLVLSNSEGTLPRLRELGARRAEALFLGADPALFAPLPVEKEHDVLFYAYGDRFRRNWVSELIGEPSKRLAGVDFVLGGSDIRGDVGRARELRYFPVNQLSRIISASRINLNIARKPHAEVYGSSTSRLFELAAAGAAIVSNPNEGIERWFEPGRELLVASDADEAVEAYQTLLDDPQAAAELGRRARERVLEEHTFADRARQLLDLVGVGSSSTAPPS
jgi:glycosyltransferase involved in cell wall biosynthesis